MGGSWLLLSGLTRAGACSAQEVLDNYVLTSASRGAHPKQVPSKLNGTFEYFTSPYEQRVITWTPQYIIGALKKEVMEKVPWIAPAAGTLYGCVWYAQDYKRKEDMHHRF